MRWGCAARSNRWACATIKTEQERMLVDFKLKVHRRDRPRFALYLVWIRAKWDIRMVFKAGPYASAVWPLICIRSRFRPPPWQQRASPKSVHWELEGVGQGHSEKWFHTLGLFLVSQVTIYYKVLASFGLSYRAKCYKISGAWLFWGLWAYPAVQAKLWPGYRN